MTNIRRILINIFYLLVIVAIPTSLFAYQADVQNLSQEEYYQSTLDSINGAQESIFVVMYYVNWSPFDKESKPHSIIQALIAAHKRGVKVRVILDQTMTVTGDHDEVVEDWELLKAKNIYAYELLQREGIDVSFDLASVNTHSKVLVVDEEIVILGSSNWTETALNSNVESNVLIKSKKIAESLLNDFKDAKLQIPTIVTSTSSIKVPFKFLEDPKLLGEMASQNDERALDIYLLLLRYTDQQKHTVTISYDKIKEDLKLTQDQARVFINRVFEKLRDKYGLIGFEKEDIFRKDTVTLKMEQMADERVIELPVIYFSYGWNERLSLRAKVMYLVSLEYYTVSDSKPWFFASRKMIEKQFNLKKWYISNGMQELRSLNIIDVKYGKIKKGSEEARMANHYKVIGLYDPTKVDNKFKEMADRYGEANVQKARNYAKVVWKDNDYEAIEVLLKLKTDYGEEAIKKAVRIVAKKRTDNPKRNFNYLKAIIVKFSMGN